MVTGVMVSPLSPMVTLGYRIIMLPDVIVLCWRLFELLTPHAFRGLTVHCFLSVYPARSPYHL